MRVIGLEFDKQRKKRRIKDSLPHFDVPHGKRSLSCCRRCFYYFWDNQQRPSHRTSCFRIRRAAQRKINPCAARMDQKATPFCCPVRSISCMECTRITPGTTSSNRLARVPEPGPLVSALNKSTALWGHTWSMTRSLKRDHLSCNRDKKTGFSSERPIQNRFCGASSRGDRSSVTSNVTPRANLVFTFREWIKSSHW